MQNTAPKLLLAILLLAQFACQSDIETIDVQNEYGQRERYERRKSDFAKHGLYQRFHEEGYLLEEARYANDSLDGERRYYFPNGKVERVEHHRMGVFHGKYQQYYESGRLQLEQEFVDGVLQGEGKTWYRNGQLKEKLNFQNNEENGPFTEWYENGKLKAEGAYLGGDNEHGTLKLYDTLGQLERVLECQRGVCNTTWVRE